MVSYKNNRSHTYGILIPAPQNLLLGAEINYFVSEMKLLCVKPDNLITISNRSI